MQTNHLEFQVERLERRQMLAGNVSMSISAAGDVILNGDSADNQIEISLEPGDGGFVGVVNGLGGTSIRLNGQSATRQYFDVMPIDDVEIIPGLIASNSSQTTLGDLRISMRGGDDHVEINPWFGAVAIGIGVGDDLRVDLGSGNDTFEFHGAGSTRYNVVGSFREIPWTTVADRTDIFGRGGDDDIEIWNISFADRLLVNEGSAVTTYPGDGGSLVEMSMIAAGADIDLRGTSNSQEFRVSDLYVAGDVRANLGAGRDHFQLNDAIVRQSVSLNIGSVINGGIESMMVYDSFVGDDVVLRGGGGNQSIRLRGMYVPGNVDVRLGSGDDTLVSNSSGLSRYGDFTVNAGGGNDTVVISGGTIVDQDLVLNMGGGDDLIIVEFHLPTDGPNPPRANDVWFVGGGGFDEVQNLDDLVNSGSLTLNSIELRS